MSNEKSSIESLKEFAKRSGREFKYSETPYPSTAMSKITYHRRTLYIPDGKTFFVCFADSKEMGPKALFSGVFVPYDTPSTFKMEVRKKDILDKLNPFGKKKYCKTGIPTFDSMVRISSDDPAAVKRIFQDRKIQNLVLDAFKFDGVIIIGIKELDVDFVPGLKGKSHLGVYTQEEWITDGKRIEKLYLIMDEFQY